MSGHRPWVVGSSRARSPRQLPTALLLSGGFIVAADMRVITSLLPAIADDYDVSIGAAGLTVAVYALAYAAGLMVYGRLGDRVGRVRVIRAALLAFASGTLLCSEAPSFAALLVLRVLTAVAGAAVIPMSLAHLGDTIADYRARQRAIGVFLSAIVSGQVLGQAVGGILAGVLSWRAIFVLLGATGFVLAAAIWTYPCPQGFGTPTEKRAARRIFAADRPLFLLTMCEAFFFVSAFSFAGASLVAAHHVSYPLMGSLLAAFGLGSVLASRTVPMLTASAGDAMRVRVGAVVMATGFVVLATAPPVVLFGAAVLVLGVGFTLAHSALQTRATEVSPRARGTAVSLFAGLSNVGAAIGTFAAGAVVDGPGYATVFTIAAGGMLLLAAVARAQLPPRTAPALRVGVAGARV